MGSTIKMIETKKNWQAIIKKKKNYCRREYLFVRQRMSWLKLWRPEGSQAFFKCRKKMTFNWKFHIQQNYPLGIKEK